MKKFMPMTRSFSIPGSGVRVKIVQDHDGDLGIRFELGSNDVTHLILSYQPELIESLGFPITGSCSVEGPSADLVPVEAA